MALEAAVPQLIVVFGASGDLSKKKILPALYNLSLQGLLPDQHAIVGYAFSDWDDDAFKAYARESIEQFSRTPLDETAWKRFADSLTFVAGGFDDSTAIAKLAQRLTEVDEQQHADGGRLYYLATPPAFFAPIATLLGKAGQATPKSRIVFEKPFGDSLESAKELSETVHKTFNESQVFRIDHYLGKETVQNMVVFRFGNALWERVWNRDAVDLVQLTVAEEIGVEGRSAYYEKAGAIRDLLQNHMLQVLAFLTMEPPRSLDAEAFRDEKVKLLQTIRPLDPAEVVRGQYEGYRSEPGVNPESDTETYVAAKVWIDNWRWEGIPFYLRHGKRLPHKATEITVVFRGAPDYLFKETGLPELEHDHVTIRIQPDEGISFSFQAKVPGPGYDIQSVKMDFDYERSFMHASAEAYERLIHDAMDGDHTLFTRADGVEASWKVVEPVLQNPPALQTYAVGTWGPSAADALIAPYHWHLGDVE